MSDYLIVRGGEHAEIDHVLREWKTQNRWVNMIEINHRWDPQELEVNRVNAVGRLRGKHKLDLAELILMLAQIDAHVIHVKLRKTERDEIDLIDWAKGLLGAGE